MADENLAGSRTIETVNDLMSQIQQEIIETKVGDLAPDKARVIMKARALQLNIIQLTLQAARLDPRLKAPLRERLGLPEPQAPPTSVKALDTDHKK